MSARPAARVIGLGNPAAGDDGVGFAVVEALRGCLDPSVALLCCADPAQLVEWLGDGVPTVLVDAVRVDAVRVDGARVDGARVDGARMDGARVDGALSEPPGRVLLLGVEALGERSPPVSSHGLGVAEALALAAVLWGVLPPLWVVGVTVSGGLRMGHGLSPEVTVAVIVAAKKVTEIVKKM